jgi:signal transduction histidine kinase
MNRTSLWLRIVTAQLAITLILAAVLPFVVDRTIHAIGNELTQHFLSSVTQRSSAALRATPVSPGSNDPRYGAVATFLIQGNRIDQLAGPHIEDIAARPIPRGNNPVFSQGPYSDFYLMPEDLNGQWILAAEDRRHPAVLIDDIIRYFLHRFFLIIPFLLLLSTGVTLVIVRLAMGPIRRATVEVAAIDVAKPSLRINELAMPKDIWPLVHATNTTLERLEHALDRERRFNAAVTHELRTSLSTILLRGEALPVGRERSAIEQAVARAAGVIDQMLELGAIESGLVNLSEFHLAGPVREVIVQIRPILLSAGRALSLECNEDASVHVIASEALVMIALRNLIDNAHRHSTLGGSIVVRCDCAAGTLTVADIGPGISVREEPGGRQVFARADGVRSQSSGLGLAIVRRAIDTCGGTLTFDRATGGGTIAKLEFRTVA